MLSAIGSKLWQFLAAIVGGVAMVFAALWWIAASQRDKAREKAARKSREAVARKQAQKQSRKARKASQTAKESGDAAVQQTREQADSGRRDHFESGFGGMRND